MIGQQRLHVCRALLLLDKARCTAVPIATAVAAQPRHVPKSPLKPYLNSRYIEVLPGNTPSSNSLLQ
jgi:hypothetical protein